MLVTIKEKQQASRRGVLAAQWLASAKHKEFCNYFPVTAIASNEKTTADEDYVPSLPKHAGPSKAPLSSTLHRSTIDKRVDAIIPPMQAIADSENTSLVQLLLIVLVKLCRRLGWATLAKLLYSVFISMTDIDNSSLMSLETSSSIMVSQ